MGLLTFRRYRKFNNRVYLLWGIGLMGLGLAWMGTSVSFLMILITGEGLSIRTYFFATLFWMAITSFFWMWTMTELLIKDKKRIILLLYGIIGIIYEIFLVYSLFDNPSNLGTLNNPPLDSEYQGIVMLYILFALSCVSISLFIFIWKSLKLDDKEIRLKSKFLLIGLISYIIGSLADGMFHLDITTIIIIRILLILSAIEFYIGWNLPDSVKKIFLKD